MKIVFVIDQVYLHGGIERILSIKANYFSDQKNDEVHIVTTEQKGNAPCYPFSDKITFKDIGINYERKKSYYHPTNLKKLPIHFLRLRSYIKKVSPDVVVVCSHSTDTYFVPFLCKKVPKVKEFHYSKYFEETDKKETKSKFQSRFYRFTEYVEKKYDSIVVLNKDERQYYPSDNVFVIPNPLTFFPDKVADVKNNKTIICAGRVAQVKGFDNLIDIWKQIYQEFPDWKIEIYGSGTKEYETYLAEKVKENNLEKSLFLMGATDDVRGKMQNAAIYAMTSHTECFPLVLLEAQSSGLPVITYDCPNGPRNIVVNETGVLVENQNQTAFASALRSLIKNEEKISIYGTNARNNAKNYLEEAVMNQWIEMFHQICRTK